MNPLTALPTKGRKWIYVSYATLGIAFGATQVGFATANVDQPTWLLVAFGVFGYLGTALGLVAAANTQPVSEAQVEAFQAAARQQAIVLREAGKDAQAPAFRLEGKDLVAILKKEKRDNGNRDLGI